MDREARVSLDAYRCLYAGSAVTEIGGVTVLRAEAAPQSPMLNQIVGLGVDEPATEAVLDAALEAIGDDVTCYVAVAPEAQPAELAGWLRERGLEPGWGWMSFRRNLEPVPADRRRSTSFASDPPRHRTSAGSSPRATAFPMPLCRGRHRPGTSAGSAGSPSTATSLRRRRGFSSPRASGTSASRPPSPSTAARVPRMRCSPRGSIRAREVGCDVVVTETGERRDDLPSNSYRNILRAGFTEVAVRANWLRPRPASRPRRTRSRASAAAGSGRPSAPGG